MHLMKNANRYVIFITVVVMVMSFIVLYTEAPAEKKSLTSETDTSDLQTYQNEEYGFKFEYPKIYAETKGCEIREMNGTILLGSRIRIEIVDSDGLTLDAYAQRHVDQIYTAGPDDKFQSKQTFFGENPAIVVNYRTVGIGRYGETVFLLHDGKIYTFAFLAGAPCVNDMVELVTLRELLSTLRFIER